jgi:hypothetical protein
MRTRYTSPVWRALRGRQRPPSFPPLRLDADDPVREALHALLLLGGWGVYQGSRAQLWALARRALRELDGDPMSAEEARAFMSRIEMAGGLRHDPGSGSRVTAAAPGDPPGYAEALRIVQGDSSAVAWPNTAAPPSGNAAGSPPGKEGDNGAT